MAGDLQVTQCFLATHLDFVHLQIYLKSSLGKNGTFCNDTPRAHTHEREVGIGNLTSAVWGCSLGQCG